MTEHDPRALALLRELIDTPATTGQEGAVAAILERELSAAGYHVERQGLEGERANLVATWPGERARLLFSTHIDTVPPHIPYRREGDTIYGRGACDTKGGIVAMLEAGGRLRGAGAGEFGYLFVVGEEVDHAGAKAARALPLAPERIILCEPTLCRVVAAQKGVVKVRLEAEGRAAHSAFPHRGVSAVDRLLATLEALRRRDWPRHELLGETFFNVGLLSGGVAANVLAPRAEAELMFRTVGPTEEILSAIEDALVEGVSSRVLTENAPELFEVPDGYETGIASFNTDATFLKALGPIVLVGPGDIEVAHSVDEHITLDELERGTDLYVRLAGQLL
jgi:acetylornithine deacetylase